MSAYVPRSSVGYSAVAAAADAKAARTGGHSAAERTRMQRNESRVEEVRASKNPFACKTAGMRQCDINVRPSLVGSITPNSVNVPSRSRDGAGYMRSPAQALDYETSTLNPKRTLLRSHCYMCAAAAAGGGG